MDIYENSQYVQVIFRRMPIVEREVVCPNKQYAYLLTGVNRGPGRDLSNNMFYRQIRHFHF